MKAKMLVLAALCFSLFAAEEDIKSVEIETLLTPADRLEYGGYRILRTCEFKEFIACKYVVSKNGINLVSFPEDNAGLENGVVLGDEKGIAHPDYLKAGLVKLIAKNPPVLKPVLKNVSAEVTPEKKAVTAESMFLPLVPVTNEVTPEIAAPYVPLEELVFMSYSGGAHCCWDYAVYTLEPEFKKVYDSYEWRTGYGVSFADLDKDGTSELIQSSLKYEYAFGAAHVDSAFPLVVFKYDETKKQYRPANRKYKDYILSELKKIILTAVDNEKEPWMSPVIMHVLTYLYLGMDKKAWQVYDKYYKLKNKDAVKKEILSAIASDPVFIALSAKQK